MQQQLVIKPGTSSAQVSMQPGMMTVPMTVSSSMPGPNVMSLSKPGGQNVVVTTQNMTAGQPALMPNVQILNMRPGTPTIGAPKSVAAVSPRVVIGSPQVVGTRTAAPGITLQTLQSLQPGQQGHLLLKTENGQYQLLRVGPAPAAAAVASNLAAPPSQTIRLSTGPAHPGVATASTTAAPLQPLPPAVGLGHAPTAAAGLAQSAGGPSSAAVMTPVQAMTSVPGPDASVSAATHGAQQQQQFQPPPANAPAYVKPSDNTKEKCRNFLANLLDLSSKEPATVENNVRKLIQELIDAKVEPEEFCNRLERLLNASPQPCLIGFLKKSLPLLRQSLVMEDLVIEGINPPPHQVAFPNIPLHAMQPMRSVPVAVLPIQRAMNMRRAGKFIIRRPLNLKTLAMLAIEKQIRLAQEEAVLFEPSQYEACIIPRLLNLKALAILALEKHFRLAKDEVARVLRVIIPGPLNLKKLAILSVEEQLRMADNELSKKDPARVTPSILPRQFHLKILAIFAVENYLETAQKETSNYEVARVTKLTITRPLYLKTLARLVVEKHSRLAKEVAAELEPPKRESVKPEPAKREPAVATKCISRRHLSLKTSASYAAENKLRLAQKETAKFVPIKPEPSESARDTKCIINRPLNLKTLASFAVDKKLRLAQIEHAKAESAKREPAYPVTAEPRPGDV